MKIINSLLRARTFLVLALLGLTLSFTGCYPVEEHRHSRYYDGPGYRNGYREREVYRDDRYRGDGYRNDSYRRDSYRSEGYRNDSYRRSYPAARSTTYYSSTPRRTVVVRRTGYTTY